MLSVFLFLLAYVPSGIGALILFILIILILLRMRKSHATATVAPVYPKKRNFRGWYMKASATNKYPVEVVDFDFYSKLYSRSHTIEGSVYGSTFNYEGMAEGEKGQEFKTSLPKYLDLRWFSLVDKELYSLEAKLPLKQIWELFSKEYDDLLGWDENGKPVIGKVRLDVLDLCILPYGKVVLYMSSSGNPIKQEGSSCVLSVSPENNVRLLDWSRYGDNVELLEDAWFYDPTGPKLLNEHMDWVLKNYPKIELDKNFSLDSIDRYFERFAYRINLVFENGNTTFHLARVAYSNAEKCFFSSLDAPVEIEKPSFIKRYFFEWSYRNYAYEAECSFCEEETMRIFDEAYGSDHDQDGVLNVIVHYDDQIEISLDVAGKKFFFEKMTIGVTRVSKIDKDGDYSKSDYETVYCLNCDDDNYVGEWSVY